MNRIDKLPFPHLIGELLDYSPRIKTDKALRVYRKCVVAGKHELAAKILAKYPPNRYGMAYDITDAVGVSLFASKNLGKTP